MRLLLLALAQGLFALAVSVLAAPAHAQAPPPQPSKPGAPDAAAVTPTQGEPAAPPLLEINDPMLAPVAPASNQLKTWQRALSLIRQNATALKTGQLQVRLQEARSSEVLGRAMPKLTGIAQINRHILVGEAPDFAGNLRPAPDPATTWNMGLGLLVPIVASKAWYDYGTAKDLIDLRRLELGEIERQMVSVAADAIIRVVTSERLAEVSRVNLKSALSLLGLNRRRARLGSASAIDVLRTEQEVSRSRAQLISADEGVLSAREQLGLALGTDVSWGVTPDIDLNDLAKEARSSCTQETTVDNRIDIRAASANVAIAEREVTSVDHLFVPTVDGQSQYTFWSDNAIAYRERHTWTIGAVLTWNIYDGGVRYGSKRAAETALDMARESASDRRRQARVEVARALRNIELAEAQLKVSNRAREIARQAAKFAQITFVNGTGTSFDMVDTARSQREAEIDVTIKEFELLRAKIAAFLALATCKV